MLSLLPFPTLVWSIIVNICILYITPETRDVVTASSEVWGIPKLCPATQQQGSETQLYLYVLPVTVFVGRPSVVGVVESGLSRQPALIVESWRGGDLVVCDLSRLEAKFVAAVESYRKNRAGNIAGDLSLLFIYLSEQ